MSTKDVIHAHSYQHFEELQLSSDIFYGLLETMIKDYKYPDVTVKRVKLSEGGMFSSNREYLCIKRKEYVYNVCASAFGKSFFISWWLKEEGNILQQMPVIGRFLARRATQKTYYQLDTELMFTQSIDALVKTAVEKVKSERGFLNTERLLN